MGFAERAQNVVAIHIFYCGGDVQYSVVSDPIFVYLQSYRWKYTDWEKPVPGNPGSKKRK